MNTIIEVLIDFELSTILIFTIIINIYFGNTNTIKQLQVIYCRNKLSDVTLEKLVFLKENKTL